MAISLECGQLRIRKKLQFITIFQFNKVIGEYLKGFRSITRKIQPDILHTSDPFMSRQVDLNLGLLLDYFTQTTNMVIMAMCKKDAFERFLVIPKPCFNSLSSTTVYQPDILTILFV